MSTTLPTSARTELGSGLWRPGVEASTSPAAWRDSGRATAVHTAGREVGCRLNRLLDEEGIDHIAVDIEGETREALVLFETASRRSQHIVPPGPDLDYGTLQGPEICPLLPHGFSCARKGIFCKN
ncbi:hypothetical protein [Streptomyces sp. cg2]|uniref:hypothetical protein n=1 Tax=Streptomyces sp. cg2 TaxID=3238799 RepID=UPI0034E1C2B5